MSINNCAIPSPRNTTASNGFSLIEILVSLGVVAALVTLGAGAWRGALDKGERARETAAGRTLISAYLNYAAEHDGQLMVAHYEGRSPEVDDQEVVLPGGIRLSGGSLHRYPYRLSPYFEYKIDGVILVNHNKKQIEKTFSGSMREYGVSLCPAFGINYYFVGGYKVDNQFSSEQLQETTFRAVQVSKPSSLLVFATAFTPDVEGVRMNGRFGIEPPAYKTALWDQNLHVDARHDGRALCVFLDGSIRAQTIDELRDMRLWSKNAQLTDNPNYRVATSSSGGIGGGGRR